MSEKGEEDELEGYDLSEGVEEGGEEEDEEDDDIYAKHQELEDEDENGAAGAANPGTIDKDEEFAVGLPQDAEEYCARLEKFIFPFVLESIKNDEFFMSKPAISQKRTLMVVDVVGFSNFVEILSSAPVIEFIESFFSFCEKIIVEKKGRVLQFVGDAVIAMFNDGAADDALLSGMTILQKIDRLRQLARDEEKNGERIPEEMLYCTIALSRAEVIEGKVGTETTGTYCCMGDGMNIVNYLQKLSCEVPYYMLFDDGIAEGITKFSKESMINLGKHRIKGRATPISVHTMSVEINKKPADLQLQIDEFIDNFTTEEIKKLRLAQRKETIARNGRTSTFALTTGGSSPGMRQKSFDEKSAEKANFPEKQERSPNERMPEPTPEKSKLQEKPVIIDKPVQPNPILQEQIEELEKKLRRMQEELKFRNEELKARNEDHKNRTEELKYKIDELKRREAELDFQDQQLDKKEEEVSKKMLENTQRETEMNMKEHELARREQEIISKSQEMERRLKQMSEKRGSISKNLLLPDGMSSSSLIDTIPESAQKLEENQTVLNNQVSIMALQNLLQQQIQFTNDKIKNLEQKMADDKEKHKEEIKKLQNEFKQIMNGNKNSPRSPPVVKGTSCFGLTSSPKVHPFN